MMNDEVKTTAENVDLRQYLFSYVFLNQINHRGHELKKIRGEGEKKRRRSCALRALKKWPMATPLFLILLSSSLLTFYLFFVAKILSVSSVSSVAKLKINFLRVSSRIFAAEIKIAVKSVG